MSPLVRGRKVTENRQEAVGARAAQAGVDRMTWGAGGGWGLRRVLGGAGRGVGVVGGGRVAVMGAVVVGVRVTVKGQGALGAREALQAGPPVGAVAASARVKLPVVVGVERETAVG